MDRIRRELELKAQDRFRVWIEGERIVIEREPSTLEDVIGSLPPIDLEPETDFDALIEAATEDELFGKHGKYRQRHG